MHGSTLARTTERNTRVVDITIVEFITMFSRDYLWLCELTSIGIAAQRDLDLRAVYARHLLRAVQSQFCLLRNIVRVGLMVGNTKCACQYLLVQTRTGRKEGTYFHGVKENEDGVLSLRSIQRGSIRVRARLASRQ